MIDIEKAFEKAAQIPDSKELLETAQICSTFKQRPSEYKNIQDEIEAVAYDLACSRVLEVYNVQKSQRDAAELGKMLGKILKSGLINDLQNHGSLYNEILKIIEENK